MNQRNITLHIYLLTSILSVSSCGSENRDSASNLQSGKVSFVQLRPSGPGYYTFVPYNRLWGTPETIASMKRAGRRWKDQWYSEFYSDIGVNDISFKNGGPMPPHKSHRRGKDIDLRPMRDDGRRKPTSVTSSTYSHYGNLDLILEALKPAFDLRIILFNDPDIYDSFQKGSSCKRAHMDGERLRYVKCWSGHHNHLHVSSHR